MIVSLKPIVTTCKKKTINEKSSGVKKTNYIIIIEGQEVYIPADKISKYINVISTDKSAYNAEDLTIINGIAWIKLIDVKESPIVNDIYKVCLNSSNYEKIDNFDQIHEDIEDGSFIYAIKY